MQEVYHRYHAQISDRYASLPDGTDRREAYYAEVERLLAGLPPSR